MQPSARTSRANCIATRHHSIDGYLHSTDGERNSEHCLSTCRPFCDICIDSAGSINLDEFFCCLATEMGIRDSKRLRIRANSRDHLLRNQNINHATYHSCPFVLPRVTWCSDESVAFIDMRRYHWRYMKITRSHMSSLRWGPEMCARCRSSGSIAGVIRSNTRGRVHTSTGTMRSGSRRPPSRHWCTQWFSCRR